MSEGQESSAALAAADRLFRGPCEFVAGATHIEEIPAPALPEIAFVGRSNAGKSSLINALTGRTALARVSRTPGRTRQINFFRLNDALMLVDLPGYGYAEASKALAAGWQKLIFDYLRGRPNLKRAVVLVDARRGVLDADHEAMRLLDSAAVSYLVVLTKADKLTSSDAAEMRVRAALALNSHTAAFPDVFVTSSSTAAGLGRLRAHLAALAGERRLGV